VALVLLVGGGLVVSTWQSTISAGAVSASDNRPTLLRDAEWNKPETAKNFLQRFGRGSSEASLLRWLHAASFQTDQLARRATLTVTGLPCRERIAVTWNASSGVISEASATVSEAGCL
jgi:hypothetical protein